MAVDVRAFVLRENEKDLARIDATTPGWMSFVAFVGDPENQLALASLGNAGKELVKLARNFVINFSDDGIGFSIRSMQTGLRNPLEVDRVKIDMLKGEYQFMVPRGRIAGYVDDKGRYYISEGNHRMVAAQEIYKDTGDVSYIKKLIENGVWTKVGKSISGSKPMPVRK
ncbi:hypothetical protein [Microvirgula aerodenitrificans]|uniref:hypothetical protein n=1 Tax=Microvirgula aerodenitrificans TaxID=57480 RepID=UPI002F420688